MAAKKADPASRTVGLFTGKTALQEAEEEAAEVVALAAPTGKKQAMDPDHVDVTWFRNDMGIAGEDEIKLALVKPGGYLIRRLVKVGGKVLSMSDLLLTGRQYHQLIQCVREERKQAAENKANGKE